MNNISDCTFYPAFSSRSDLNIFGSNALLLYALQLHFDIDDILSVGTASITDGSDDKKLDLIYIDEDIKTVVVAQSYMSGNINKKEAKANKASDLNSGISWLLNQDIDQVPDSLKSHAIELRHLLETNEIESFFAWYVHNLPESNNVAKEMSSVSHTINSSLKSNFHGSEHVNVLSLEVGINKIEDWYQSIINPIHVKDSIELELSGGYKIEDENWEGFVTSISAEWLYEIYQKYRKDLFSANVREYLGSRKSDVNINNGIKNTALNNPRNFWIFNNGLTALVHNFDWNSNKTKLTIDGLSIVNGAQTTGAIGSLEEPPSEDARIPMRFIKCNQQDLIYGIVRYNNSQNKIAAPDYRSNDPIQKRLVQEFQTIPDVEYIARRGVQEDPAQKKMTQILSVTAGQALASLNNDPGNAYHKKNKIWEDDALYVKYFNQATNARNILFSYSLLKAIENRKVQLMSKRRMAEIKKTDADQLEFFRKRGSIHMFLSAISKSLETLIDKPIPSLLLIKFKNTINLEEALLIWKPIIDTSIPFVNHLSEGLSDGFRNSSAVNNAIDTFVSLVEATKQPNDEIYSSFRKNVILG